MGTQSASKWTGRTKGADSTSQDSFTTEHHVIRTVTVGMCHRDKREPGLPYVSRPLQELKIGVQRIAVICPYEDQQREENGSEGQEVRES